MGKGILFIIAAAMLAAGVYGFSGERTRLATSDRQASHQRDVLARNAALAGFELAKQRLTENFAATALAGSFGGGSYDVSISVTGDEARITSKGSYGDAEIDAIGDFRRELVNVYDVVPQFMRYALISDGPLSLNGNILGEIYVQGADVSVLNANMHTNDGLSVQGNSVRVQGFGTYGTSASFSTEKARSNSFQPNYNPSASEPVTKTAAISIPDFNSAEYVAKKTPNATAAGDLTLAGTYDLGGTRGDPYVWHVTGSLTFSSTATFSGYVLFVVDQDVHAFGDVLANASGYDGADESSLALYAGNRIELGGSTTVYAQMFAGGDVVFLNGTPTIFGSITTKGSSDLRGTPKIYYRNASPALTYIWQDSRTAIRLTAYNEM